MLEAIFSGLVIGAIYALVALSLSIIFATTNIVNFALGEVVMVACMVALTTIVSLKWPILAGIFLILAVVLLLSYLLQSIALKRLQRVDANTAFMLTLAAGIILNNAALLPLRLPRSVSRPPARRLSPSCAKPPGALRRTTWPPQPGSSPILRGSAKR